MPDRETFAIPFTFYSIQLDLTRCAGVLMGSSGMEDQENPEVEKIPDTERSQEVHRVVNDGSVIVLEDDGDYD